ncbi:DUF6214 family protein [Streptomyces liliifuscus]|uniref:Uncharacterized protein n=1 Tax=Streptomyces liliifuscus TaxID=2797636 RepID=A0A7T7L2M3_9ACTN|nr:DUF6214 family protein [Streptomyces liliifuscus]QQM45338.1 hypothetical protein JEQ17_41985 [Streptomyces liliifuscus]
MSVWPVWEVRECEQERDTASTWCNVRLTFDDGAQVDMLAVVCDGCVSIEDVRAQPALSLDDLAVLPEWIEGPLLEACGGAAEPAGVASAEGSSGKRHARPARPRGIEGRRFVAGEYLAAQGAGRDPVLAVMSATGHSRRRALRLIAGARDAGLLTPRHVRR